MMTLSQWQTSRRVDHVHFAKWNIRFRGNPDQELKAFDAPVGAFNQANNFHDRISALGEIIQRAAAYVGGVHAANTLNPVQQLDQRAKQDLQVLLAGTRIVYNTMLQQLVTNPNALVGKTVTINCYIACDIGQEGANYNAVDAVINNHIQAANQVFNAAGAQLTVVRNPAQNGVSEAISAIDPNAGATFNNVILNPAGNAYPGMQNRPGNDLIVTQLNNKRGLFGDYGRAVLAAYFNANARGPAGSIDIVYVPEFDQDGVQGVTTRPTSNGIATLPNRAFIAINRVQKSPVTYSTTLCHELIHALIDNGDHATNGNNLLADGGTRGAVNQLTWGQICAIRSNPSAV